MNFLLVAVCISAERAAAQRPASLRLPWDVPAAEGATQLLSAGFTRRAVEDRHLRTGNGFRRTPGDAALATYTRSAGGVTESVMVRSEGGGPPAHLVYTAVGDSAALQARLDAVAADAGRLGAPAAERALRVWTANAGRLTVPQRPSRLPHGGYQVAVFFIRGRGGVP